MQNLASINAFKAGLDLFKLSKPDSINGFWKFSEEIFHGISNKSEHVNYLLAKISCFSHFLILVFLIVHF